MIIVKERRQEREERREREKRKRTPPPHSPSHPTLSLLPVCRLKTSPCEGSKRFSVHWQNARMLNTCGRFAGTHGCVLNLHTETFLTYTRGVGFRVPSRATQNTHHTAHHTPRIHTHKTPHTTHCAPTPASTPHIATQHSTPQHQNTKRTSHTHTLST